jgi:lysophospholipase L1-like esterase
LVVRRILSNLLATLISLVITAVGLELLTRLIADDGMQFDLEMWKYAREIKQLAADPLIGHEHAPNRQARLMGVDFRTNSQGLRDREFSFERVHGKLRIVVLGDSLTVGWGVPLEETFAKRIEQMYVDAGVDAEVINLGVGNYNTAQEVQAFLTKGYRYQPDVVVLNYFVNDAEPTASVSAPSVLMRGCYACVFVAGRGDALMRQFFGRLDWTQYYLSLYGDGTARGWLDAKAAIGRLAEFSKASGIRLVIVSLPELHDVANYRFGRVTDLVRKSAEENGAAFVDVLPALAEQPSAKLWVTPPDPHPNAYANALIATALFEALQRVEP